MSTAVRDILLRAVRARRHLPGRGWAHVDCAERWLDSASSEEAA